MCSFRQVLKPLHITLSKAWNPKITLQHYTYPLRVCETDQGQQERQSQQEETEMETRHGQNFSNCAQVLASGKQKKLTIQTKKRPKIYLIQSSEVKIQLLRYTTSNTVKKVLILILFCACLLSLHSRTTRRGRAFNTPRLHPFTLTSEGESGQRWPYHMEGCLSDWVCFAPGGRTNTDVLN